MGNHGKPSPFQDSPTNSNKMNGLQMLLLCVQNEDWDGIHVPTREIVPWFFKVATPHQHRLPAAKSQVQSEQAPAAVLGR